VQEWGDADGNARAFDWTWLVNGGVGGWRRAEDVLGLGTSRPYGMASSSGDLVLRVDVDGAQPAR
jgi:hypothetical protein